MKRIWTLCATLVVAAIGVTPWQASAQSLARQYRIDWQAVSYVSQQSCASASIVNEGDAFFQVNGIPIPTYTVAGAFVRRPNRDEFNRFRADFGGSLLRWGSNDFFFNVYTQGGNDYCTLAENIVNLNSAGLQERRLFYIVRDGKPFTGVANVALQLSEINPTLASSLASLEVELIRELDRLSRLSDSLDSARAQATQLTALQDELKQLMSRSLDSITDAELRTLIEKYNTVPSSVRDRLVQFLKDLKTSISELRAEIDRIVADFRGQVDLLDRYTLPTQPTGGVDLDNPDTYSPDLNDEQVSEVEAPDVSSGDPFDPNNDPYRAFADQIIVELHRTVSSGVVVDRQGFLSVVRLWRFNQDVFERGLKSRVGVSTEEWGAFLNAQQSVLAEIQVYMGEGDWFRDTPVRETTKAFVAMLEQRGDTSAQAYALKNNLNLWQGTATAQQNLVLDSLEALHGGYQAMNEGVAAEDPTIPTTLNRLLDGAATATKIAATVAISLSPAGDFVDLCEVVTGKELCNPWGAELSGSDRMASGMGLIIGSGQFWRTVGNTVGIGLGAVPMAKIGGFIDSCSDLTKEQRQALVARLSEGVLEHLDGITGQQILKLLDKTMKDDAVKVLAPYLKGRGLQAASERTMLKVDAVWVELAKTKGLAAQGLPSVYKRSRAEVQEMLRSSGFGSPVRDMNDKIVGWSNLPVLDRGQEIWMHPDHSLIRIDMVGTPKNPYPQVKKEIVESQGTYGNSDTVVKIADDGMLSPLGPSEAKNYMAQWFSKQTGIHVLQVKEMGAELEALLKPWSYAVHIEIIP
ncbi:hypothetical protein [Myxococcus fulvus]|uniref:hypothetical protein n=1 Tax=Myxococcus fulvus TaxID=33 RepID=UPI0020BDB2B7|nr:hypothetical protein [Myxococcus fulvus]MCK8503227.1 hypothetical protein [Myxococcus fulvus]